jgi:hypothetical protein
MIMANYGYGKLWLWQTLVMANQDYDNHEYQSHRLANHDYSKPDLSQFDN